MQFSFKTIEDSTDKFSESNMIGQGGFGQVYMVISSLLFSDMLLLFMKLNKSIIKTKAGSISVV